jgi:hypothetical protein
MAAVLGEAWEGWPQQPAAPPASQPGSPALPGSGIKTSGNRAKVKDKAVWTELRENLFQDFANHENPLSCLPNLFCCSY